MSWPEAIRSALHGYFDFSGRARRSEYWWWIISVYLGATVLFFVAAGLLRTTNGSSLLFLAIGLLWLFCIIPSFAVLVRRLHDQGRSGAWWLIAFIPFGSLILLGMMFVDGQPYANQWGPDPKGRNEPNYAAGPAWGQPQRPTGPAWGQPQQPAAGPAWGQPAANASPVYVAPPPLAQVAPPQAAIVTPPPATTAKVPGQRTKRYEAATHDEVLAAFYKDAADAAAHHFRPLSQTWSTGPSGEILDVVYEPSAT